MRKGTLDGRTLGDDKDLGVCQVMRRRGNQTRDDIHRLMQGTHNGRL